MWDVVLGSNFFDKYIRIFNDVEILEFLLSYNDVE